MKPRSRARNKRGRHSPDQYGSVSPDGTFRIERVLPGPIERIWAYLTDPEKRRKWFASGPMDLHVGGSVALRFHFPELTTESTPPGKQESCEVPGRITQYQPPHLLSYTWGEGADASEVTFELSEQAPNVLLVITHRRLGEREKRISVASGWHAHLCLLEEHLKGNQPSPFWSINSRMQQEYRARFTF